MARRMAGVGRVTVSERRSIMHPMIAAADASVAAAARSVRTVSGPARASLMILDEYGTVKNPGGR